MRTLLDILQGPESLRLASVLLHSSGRAAAIALVVAFCLRRVPAHQYGPPPHDALGGLGAVLVLAVRDVVGPGREVEPRRTARAGGHLRRRSRSGRDGDCRARALPGRARRPAEPLLPAPSSASRRPPRGRIGRLSGRCCDGPRPRSSSRGGSAAC